ncbi:MAG TPA: AmmeMemoRadiSam system protein A [Tepidisphaeraceae bacterium]|jgi:AmmeMemoRadiSam system protein A
MHFSAEQEKLILNLARSFVRAGLSGVVPAAPGEVEPALLEPGGCFVSLHSLEGHSLRGCVGRIDASQPLIDALRLASVQVLRDSRFARDPVSVEELSILSIEVSVLSPGRPAPTPLDFEPMEHGIFLSIGGRTGCFLPQVARETGWTREQLLDRLCLEKLGLPAPAWRNPHARLHVFSVRVLGPEPFG